MKTNKRTVAINGTEYRVSYKHLNFAESEFTPTSIKKDLISYAFILRQIKQYICLQNPHIMSPNFINEMKGISICELSINRVVKGIGFAFCGSQDQFCKKTGRKISLDRAKYDLGRLCEKRSLIYKEKS